MADASKLEKFNNVRYARLTGRHLGLILALVLAALFGFGSSQVFPPGHEEVAGVPGIQAAKWVSDSRDPDSTPGLEPRCQDPLSSRVVTSAGRPKSTLCAAGKAWPVLITSYASGFVYWLIEPIRWLGGSGLFSYRLLGVAIGLCTILLSYVLVSRMAGRVAATCAVLTMSVTPAFVVESGTLFLYETAVWPLLLFALVMFSGAGGILRGPGDAQHRPSIWKTALGSLMLGLSLAANIKALFLAFPIIAMLAYCGYRLHRGPTTTLALGALSFVLPLLPMLAFGNTGPSDSLLGQVTYRLSLLTRFTRWTELPRELGLFVLFGADIGAYVDRLIAGKAGGFGWPGLIVLGASSSLSVGALVRVLFRRKAPAALAAVGALSCAYILVSLLLYDQFPGGNYAPMHAIFGVIPGLACYSVAEKWVTSERANRLAYGLTVATMAALGWNAWTAIDKLKSVELSINATPARALAAYLEETSDGSTVITTVYNYAGVIETISGGRVVPMQAHLHLLNFGDRGKDPSTVRDLVERRWVQLVDQVSLPLRIVAPAAPKEIEEPGAEFLISSLIRVAEARGLSIQKEREFSTPTGKPAQVLYRLSAVRSE